MTEEETRLRQGLRELIAMLNARDEGALRPEDQAATEAHLRSLARELGV